VTARPQITVFVSGEGSLFRYLHEQRTSLGFEIALLVSSRMDSPAVSFAERHHIPVEKFDSQSGEVLRHRLRDLNVEGILLLGFLKQVPASIVRDFAGRIINTHPSLLPKYGGKGMFGLNVHRAVLAAGETESGCTLHFVTENYDEGKILSQKKIKLASNETPESLQIKIKELEKENLAETLPVFFSHLKRTLQ
jgi:phosphoribosylglycinamide formyltransferase-1